MIRESICGERRLSERIGVKVKVEINLASKSYYGYIYNVSQDGAYLNTITAPSETITNFMYGVTFELKFQTKIKDAITLPCELKWVNISTATGCGSIYKLGAKIIDPPANYKEFLTTL